MKYALVIVLLFAGCSVPPKHQKGGSIIQALGLKSADEEFSIPAAVTGSTGPVQMLQQPENPEGPSTQSITRTTTTTKEDGSVVTTTERAETVIGGSQDLADIMKEYLGAEYMKRLSIALIMALIAFRVRHEWPVISNILAIGALVVAYFGLAYVLAIAGLAGGIFVAYHVVKANLNPIP